MILLNTDEASQRIVVTATELVSLTGLTYFLFEVVSDDTNEPTYFVPEDVSPNTCRYNEMLITVSGGTESLTGTTTSIDLKTNGYYKYTIYQQDNSTNLDPALASGIVETGKLFLNGPVLPDVIEYTDDDDMTSNVYQG